MGIFDSRKEEEKKPVKQKEILSFKGILKFIFGLFLVLLILKVLFFSGLESHSNEFFREVFLGKDIMSLTKFGLIIIAVIAIIKILFSSD